MSEGIKSEPLCHTQIFEFLAWTSYRKKIHCLPSLVRNICGNWTLLFPRLGDFGPEREVKSQQHTSCRGYLRAFNPFFFFSVTKSHIGNVLNQPRSDKQRTRYMPNPHGKTIRKWGSVGKVPASSQVFPEQCWQARRSGLSPCQPNPGHAQQNVAFPKKQEKGVIKLYCHHRKWEIIK